MKKTILLLILILPIAVFSQTNSLKLPPGKSYTNTSSDTLIITTIEKIRTAVEKNRELKIALQEIDKSNEIIVNLEKQTKTLEEKSKLQAEVISSFETQIAASETHANNMKKEAKKQKRQKLVAMGGGALLVIISIVFI